MFVIIFSSLRRTYTPDSHQLQKETRGGREGRRGIQGHMDA